MQKKSYNIAYSRLTINQNNSIFSIIVILFCLLKRLGTLSSRILQIQLKEIEENYKKAALLDPKTRDEYIRQTRELKRIEELGRQYYKKMRLLG